MPKIKFPPLTAHEGRRAWAFLAVWGGSVVFTIFAAFAAWIVRGDPKLSFYLGLAAHIQVLVGMSCMGWIMGRRMLLDASPKGLKISDSGQLEDVIRQKAEETFGHHDDEDGAGSASGDDDTPPQFRKSTEFEG